MATSPQGESEGAAFTPGAEQGAMGGRGVGPQPFPHQWSHAISTELCATWGALMF